MPRDGIADDVADALDPLTALPAWVKGEKRLSSMLPYVSLVTDRTIRTRGNELMQCIRLEGVNSTTSEDAHLDRIGGLLAGIVAQVGTGVLLLPAQGVESGRRDPAAHPGRRVRGCRRPALARASGSGGPARQDADPDGAEAPRGRQPSALRSGGVPRAHAADTTRRLRKLDEVVGFSCRPSMS
jgi:type IV secretion system protein VirB4